MRSYDGSSRLLGRTRILYCVLAALFLIGGTAFGQQPSRRQIRRWIQQLDSADPSERSTAATQLLVSGDNQVLKSLFDAMQPDRREDVRISVITAFGVSGDDRATGMLILLLDDQSEAIRRSAESALQSVYTPQAILQMEKTLTDPEKPAHIRSKIIQVLGEMRAIESVETLIGCLSDRDPSVRRTANESLQRITLRDYGGAGEWREWWDESKDLTREQMLEDLVGLQAERIKTLLARLEDLELVVLKDSTDAELLLKALADAPSRKVRLYAIEQLRSQKGKAIVAGLLNALNDPDESVRQKAAEALGDQESADSTDKLVKSLDDPIPNVRAAAASSLGKLKAVKAVQSLTQKLSDPNEDVAAAVAFALGEIGSATAVAPLIEIFSDSKRPSKVQLAAANALAKLNDPSATPTFLKLLKSPEAHLRSAAADALGRLGAVTAIAPLGEVAAKDADPQIRELALVALGKIGKPEALDPMVAALSDKESRVRERAFDSMMLLAESNNKLYETILDRLASAREFDLAEKALAKAVEYYAAQPNHVQIVADLQHRLARNFITAKEWERAKKSLSELIASNGKRQEYYRDLGACLLAEGNQAAYRDLVEKARRDTKDEHWWGETVRLAQELAKNGKPAEIIKRIDELEKEDPALGGPTFAPALQALRATAKEKLAPPPAPPAKGKGG